MLPDVVPNTIEDEPSIVPTGVPALSAPKLEPGPVLEPEAAQPPQRRKLPRRATSRAPSLPAPETDVSETPAPAVLAEQTRPPEPVSEPMAEPPPRRVGEYLTRFSED